MKKIGFLLLTTMFGAWAYMQQKMGKTLPLTTRFIDNEEEKASILNQNETALKILSWNVFMLPWFTLMRTGQAERGKLIAKVLNYEDYDVIVFQEAFHSVGRSMIAAGLKEKFPYQVGPANPAFYPKTNSGIWIVSRLPLTFKGQIEFTGKRLGADWFSRKGALMVEAKKGDHVFQIIGTHLQAGFGKKYNAIRLGQCREILERLIEPFQEENVPQLLCGDFNTSWKFFADLPHIMNMLGVRTGPFSGSIQHTCPADDYCHSESFPNLTLDYVFYRANGKPALSIQRKVRAFLHPWKGNSRKDLSDHYAVEAVVRWA